MCGIAGIVWRDPNRPVDRHCLERMTRRLAHRGPDGEGFQLQPGFGFGHRRLSIIDLATGAQPLANEDGTVWVTFNGEIYNFQSLRERLIARGHRFTTASDTEVLVHLYEEYDTDLVDHLRGMFAFALFDTRRRRLLLARDRLGQKPLIYFHDKAGIRFASELKALVVVPEVPLELDPAALDDYLAYQYIPYPRTIYRGVHKLAPGHLAVYEDGRLSLRRYWRPPFEQEVARPQADWIEELRATLLEAVRLRLVADVPIGAFLSGGIDSTIIAGLMQRAADSQIRTFTIGFAEPDYDERPWARLAAQFLETKHWEAEFFGQLEQRIDHLAWHYDEPFADSSALPTHAVSDLATRLGRIKVALTGDGGDELFGGYTRYQALKVGSLFDRVPRIFKPFFRLPFWQWIPAKAEQKSTLRRVKRLIEILGRDEPDRYRALVAIFDDALRARLYTPEFSASLGGHRAGDFLDQLYAELPGRDLLTRTMYADLGSYLPQDLMTKVDIASMACGLECRSPLLDPEVVALAGRMPVSLKLPGRSTKSILKRAFLDLLPGELLTRPKMGFGTPMDGWLRGPLKDLLRESILGERFHQRGWFRREVVTQLVEDHWNGRWDHSHRLWSLLMLDRWARQYHDADAAILHRDVSD